jgi:anti-sigma factor RsiW
MSSCEYTNRIEAYHDGEVVGDARAAIEAHLLSCNGCSAELARLDALSSLLAKSIQPKLSQMSLHRLHRQVDAAMDSGLLRLGWTMSGIAAGLLLVASVWMTRVKPAAPTEAAAPPWVGVSLVADTDPNVREAAATPAAQWYLADASTRNDDIP